MSNIINKIGESIIASTIPPAVSQAGLGIREWIKDKRNNKSKNLLDLMTIEEIEKYLEERKSKENDK